MNISILGIPDSWNIGLQDHGRFWTWISSAPRALILAVIISIPFIYSLRSPRSLIKSDTLQRWEKNYGSFKKLSRFVLSSKDEGLHHYTLNLAIVSVCSLISRILNVLIPMLLRRVVDQLADDSNKMLPIRDIILFVLLRQVVNEVVLSLHWSKLARVEGDISNRLVCSLYDKVLSLSADYHDSKQAMETYTTINVGGPRFGRFIMSILFDKIPSIVDLAVALVTFWRLFGPRLALCMTVVAIAYAWVSQRLMPPTARRGAFATALRLRRERDDIGGDALRNWHTVAGFDNVAYEQERYRDATVRSRNYVMERNFAQLVLSWQRDFVLACGFILLALLTCARILSEDGSGSVGDFVMLLQYWNHLVFPIQNFVNWASWFDEFFIESDKMIEILEARPTVRDPEGAPDLVLTKGDIEFTDVGFSYDGKRPAVRDMSFTVRGGSTVAIVGETGGGKSTLLRLLCRLYDVDRGSIRVDGQDIRSIRLGSLMRHVTIVPQVIGIFNDTMVGNLTYGNRGATQEQCEEACRGAAIHNKILTFADGYGEKVGEQRGTKLSGGEMQRLAIARALLRDSRIVLFDEAMSSLDSETEWRIQARLREFCVDKTVIIIAHRLATVAHADLILAVKDGVIVESGNQQELLKKKGYYYNLWDKQRLQSEVSPSSPNRTE